MDTGLDFGEALEWLRAGERVSRAGWNGKGMSLLRADGGTFRAGGFVMGELEPHIVMHTADGKFVPWLASQSDVLATDWMVVR